MEEGTSSAQLWVLDIAAGVARLPVSVSAGSRCATSIQSASPDDLTSQLLPAAALAAPASMLDASGTVGVSTWCDVPFVVGAAGSSISVSPA